jgi:hypothetical protein
MASFQTKNTNFGVPWNGKGWHILWPIVFLEQFCIFNGNWVIFWFFGTFSPILVYILCQEKSGNPV